MSHFLQLLLLLSLVVLTAKLAGALAGRIGQPSVFGEILAGLLLGPTVLDVLGWPVFATVTGIGDGAAAGAGLGESLPLLPLLRDLADIGVVLLMFVAGLETDLVEMRRVGRVAFWAAFGGVVLPMVFGAATAVAFGFPLYWQGIFIGTILTATSVSISAQTLLEIGAFRSKEGATILGAAVIDDVMGILVLSLVVAFAKASGAAGASSGVDLRDLLLVGGRIVLYFGAAWACGRLLTPVLRWASTLGVSQAVLGVSLVIAFLYAWAAEYVGEVAAITGAYIAGVLIAQTPFKKDVDAGIHPLTYSLFVPIFFISIGLQANGRELGAQATFTVVLVLVAIVAKVVGSGLFARLSGFDTGESIRVGVGMISRGEVGLIVAGYGLTNGIISRDVFSASVLVVLVTTMVTPPLLRMVFPRRAGEHVQVDESIAHHP